MILEIDKKAIANLFDKIAQDKILVKDLQRKITATKTSWDEMNEIFVNLKKLDFQIKENRKKICEIIKKYV